MNETPIPDKALDAATKAIVNRERAKHGLEPVELDRLTGVHRIDYEGAAHAALVAAFDALGIRVADEHTHSHGGPA